MKYDVIIIGAGPGGIFTAYELIQQESNLNGSIQQIQLVLQTQFLELAACSGIQLRPRAAIFHIDLIHIPHEFYGPHELIQQESNLKIAVFEAGHALEARHCPIDGDKVKSC